jgi:4'-phosphopantetheinyl transferase EntD
MFQEVLPRSVILVEASASDWTSALLPEEAVLVRNAVEQRRREFQAGRACARRALAGLGFDRLPIMTGPNREPRWPPGVVGSITHTREYCAAAVARAGEFATLGIDAEVWHRARGEVERYVCSPDEAERFRREFGDEVWRTPLFSMKEAVYKAIYPLRRGSLDFRDVELDIGPVGGAFSARGVSDQAPHEDLDRIQGRFAIGWGYVFTAVWIRSGDLPTTARSGSTTRAV